MASVSASVESVAVPLTAIDRDQLSRVPCGSWIAERRRDVGYIDVAILPHAGSLDPPVPGAVLWACWPANHGETITLIGGGLWRFSGASGVDYLLRCGYGNACADLKFRMD